MSLIERRRPAFDAAFLTRAGIAWVLACMLLLAIGASTIIANRFPDPDDALRLVQVRDLLAGQGWFDLVQHRIDPAGGGVAMHWSRLADLPLAATIQVFTPLLGASLAEQVAIVLVPLLTLGIAMLLAGRIAWRLIGEEAATLACLAITISVPVIGQMRPLRIDHHGWQIVAVLVAVNALMARSPRLGGWIAGLALAAGLAISIEGLPLAAAIAGIAALRWFRGARERDLFTGLMQGLALGSAGLFLATRGLGELANHCDAISPVHLAAFGWGAAVVSLLRIFRPLPLVPTLGVFGIAAGGAMAVVLGYSPRCATGSFDMLDPVVRSFWYDQVSEGRPIWHQDPATVLQIVVPMLIAIAATLRLARQSQDWLRRWWQDYAVLLGAALAVALLVARAGAVAGALAAVPLGWQLKQWIAAARHQVRPTRRGLAMAGIVLALLPATPFTLATMAAPSEARSSAPGLAAPSASRASSCRIPEAAATLNALPQGDILAPLDIGPRLLLETGHTVVATGHHRAAPAMRAVIDAFTGTPEAARAMMHARGIDYLVFCPDLAEPGLYARAAPNGFAAQLRAGLAPGWLAPVAMPAGVDLKVWRVVS
jgi:hypothetical protein